MTRILIALLLAGVVANWAALAITHWANAQVRTALVGFHPEPVPVSAIRRPSTFAGEKL